MEKQKKSIKIIVWENLQLLAFGMTIAGQVIIGMDYLIAQIIWLTANLISLTRDFILKRPAADKIKNAGLTALTIGLIVAFIMGAFN